VHRDIKPSNILLQKTPDGAKAKVVEFGMLSAVLWVVSEFAQVYTFAIGFAASPSCKI
jgi:serine/threonine protein kinase